MSMSALLAYLRTIRLGSSRASTIARSTPAANSSSVKPRAIAQRTSALPCGPRLTNDSYSREAALPPRANASGTVAFWNCDHCRCSSFRPGDSAESCSTRSSKSPISASVDAASILFSARLSAASSRSARASGAVAATLAASDSPADFSSLAGLTPDSIQAGNTRLRTTATRPGPLLLHSSDMPASSIPWASIPSSGRSTGCPPAAVCRHARLEAA